MKSFYILAVLFFVFTLSASAQYNPDHMEKEELEKRIEALEKEVSSLNSRTLSAGSRLMDFKKQYFAGVGLIIGGTLLSVVSKDPIILAFGGLTALGGTVVQIVSFNKIGRAGEHLKFGYYGLNLQTSENGLGLAFRF